MPQNSAREYRKEGTGKSGANYPRWDTQYVGESFAALERVFRWDTDDGKDILFLQVVFAGSCTWSSVLPLGVLDGNSEEL
jgi:hypothetical protein